MLFKGKIGDFIPILKHSLIEQNLEWQISCKEIKLKVRTIAPDTECNESLEEAMFEEFMQKEFVKFYIQILKWNKDMNDVYLVDFNLLKSKSNCVFISKLEQLIEDIRQQMKKSRTLIEIQSLTIIEETLPYKG